MVRFVKRQPAGASVDIPRASRKAWELPPTVRITAGCDPVRDEDWLTVAAPGDGNSSRPSGVVVGGDPAQRITEQYAGRGRRPDDGFERSGPPFLAPTST
jgi:hypothetical protein